jgi:hypothetical protein
MDPLVHHQQLTQPAIEPYVHPPCAHGLRNRFSCGSERAHSTLTLRHVVQAASRSSRRSPDWADKPRTTTTLHNSIIFHGSLSHFDKVSTIFEFSVNHFAILLLQCSAIFMSVVSHFIELSHFIVAIVT